MKSLIGIIMIVLGVFAIIFGEKKVEYGPKWLYKPMWFKYPQQYKKVFTIFQKWIFGAMLIALGLIIIIFPYLM